MPNTIRTAPSPTSDCELCMGTDTGYRRQADKPLGGGYRSHPLTSAAADQVSNVCLSTSSS